MSFQGHHSIGLHRMLNDNIENLSSLLYSRICRSVGLLMYSAVLLLFPSVHFVWVVYLLLITPKTINNHNNLLRNEHWRAVDIIKQLQNCSFKTKMQFFAKVISEKGFIMFFFCFYFATSMTN